MRYARLLVLSVLAATAAYAHDTPQVAESTRAHYIGNEGVLVGHGSSKVVFDAFYSDSYGQYVVPDKQTRAALLEAEPPYDGVDVVFVSHIHGDHFSPQPTLAYLQARPEVRLFGPVEVADALKRVGADADVLERVTGIESAPGDEPKTFSLNGVEIAVVAIPHSGGARMANIRNLVFRVTVAGRSTVLHMGDAGIDEAAFAEQNKHWRARHVHTAFPPYWFLGDETGRRLLDETIRADHVIGIHVPAEAAGEGDAWRERHGGDLFTDPGETRKID